MGSITVGGTCENSLRFLPWPSSDRLLRNLQFPSPAKKTEEKKSPGRHWEVMPCGIVQQPKLALAAEPACEPGVSDGKKVRQSITDPIAYTSAVSGSQWWGLYVIVAWEDSHGTT